MDRGGLVGADGATHGGAFDITYMACLPNMVVMAPSNEAELIHMVATSAAIDDRPSCFRFASLGSTVSGLLTSWSNRAILKLACRPVRVSECCFGSMESAQYGLLAWVTGALETHLSAFGRLTSPVLVAIVKA